MLAYVYATTPSGQISLGSGSDFAELLNALSLLGQGERQIGETRTMVIRHLTDRGASSLLAFLTPGCHHALVSALTDPSRAEDAVIDDLAAMVDGVNTQVGSLPFVRLQLMLAPAVEACRILLAGPAPEPLLPQLRSTAVAASTLAGRLAFETHDDTASRALYAAATKQAGRLSEPWRQADVHMSHALVTMYAQDGLERPRVLVEAAVRAARTGDSVLVRARAHALQAEVAARAQLVRQVRTALGLAWYDMERDHAGDPSSSG
ncbi:hypothetical protein AB0I94_06600 [Streptomyces sp. NPDC050147]|uniref:hypothetical protein n=1 Tax=Streptomyces sp. NPDC050147 TaxID=3155513 RepID=UPI0034256B07